MAPSSAAVPTTESAPAVESSPMESASAVKTTRAAAGESPPAKIMIKPTMMIIRPVPVDSTSPSIPIKIVIRPVPIRFPVIIRVAAASRQNPEDEQPNP